MKTTSILQILVIENTTKKKQMIYKYIFPVPSLVIWRFQLVPQYMGSLLRLCSMLMALDFMLRSLYFAPLKKSRVRSQGYSLVYSR